VTHGSKLSPAKTLPAESSGGLPAFSDQTPESPFPVLFRATNGKSKIKRDEKIKISTVVQPDDLSSFYGRYAEVCRSGMDALKKRDRSKVKKRKREKRSKEPAQEAGMAKA
jgi:signal recognition particle subunit SRP14